MRRHLARLLCLPGLLLSWTSAQAHPLAPALLDLREVAPARYEVLWRTSIARAEGIGVEPDLPAECGTIESSPATLENAQALVARWTVQCPETGLVGRRLTVSGLDRSGINVIVRIRDTHGAVTQSLLSADEPSLIVPAPQTAPSVFLSYTRLGVEHLLTGFDHLLFLVGLLLLARRPRSLLVSVTAFTLGHSVTLTLATLNLVHVKQALAELGIAFSILVLANEIALPQGQPPTLFARKPWLMAFAFGLLHGLGFAGALAEVGLPSSEIPLSLFSFNLGIEIGQLLIIALVLPASRMAHKLRERMPARLRAPAQLLPPYVIGSLAAFWCCQRALILLPWSGT